MSLVLTQSNSSNTDRQVPGAQSTLTPVRRGSALALGSAGREVAEAQESLNTWRKTRGMKEIAVDGVFGTETQAAVRDFQSAVGLNKRGEVWKQGDPSPNVMKVDGILGFRTIRALDIESGRSDQLIPESEFTSLLDQALSRASRVSLSSPNFRFDPKLLSRTDTFINPNEYNEIIERASQAYGVPANLVRAVMWTESKNRADAESPKGATGLMQLMPETARELGVKNSRNPVENINGGTLYLARMLRMFDGDVELAVAAYNAGPGAVQRYGRVPPYRETQDYVRKVTGTFAQLERSTPTLLASNNTGSDTSD